MRKYRWFFLAIALMLMGSVFGQAQNDEANARAQALLEQGREAIGGSAKLKDVKSLSINGRIVRPGAAGQEELKINLMMETSENMHFVIDKHHQGESGLHEEKNFDIVIRREHKTGDPAGEPGMQKKIIIRKVDGPAGAETLPPGENLPRKMMVPPFDMINLMTAWLLKPTPHSVISYAGEAENGTLDVLEIKREHGPAARLFLDKLNHVPVMLTYRGEEPHAIFIANNGKPGKEHIEIISTGSGEDNVEAQVKDVVLRFSDHRSVDGVLLPHQITRTVNGQLDSEWLIDKYELNAKIEMFRRERRQQK